MPDDGVLERVMAMLSRGTTPPLHDVRDLVLLFERFAHIDHRLLEVIPPHTQVLLDNDLVAVAENLKILVDLRRRLIDKGLSEEEMVHKGARQGEWKP